MSTGELCRKLGLTVSVDYLRALGIKPAELTGTGAYWWANEFSLICKRLGASIAGKALT